LEREGERRAGDLERLLSAAGDGDLEADLAPSSLPFLMGLAERLRDLAACFSLERLRESLSDFTLERLLERDLRLSERERDLPPPLAERLRDFRVRDLERDFRELDLRVADLERDLRPDLERDLRPERERECLLLERDLERDLERLRERLLLRLLLRERRRLRDRERLPE